mgnify:CR=1 FL=1
MMIALLILVPQVVFHCHWHKRLHKILSSFVFNYRSDLFSLGHSYASIMIFIPFPSSTGRYQNPTSAFGGDLEKSH